MKPSPWTLIPQFTADPNLWKNAIVFPMWKGAQAISEKTIIEPSSITTFAYRAGRKVAFGYGSDTDGGTAKIVYPSTSFDKSGISKLTFVAWGHSNINSNATITTGKCFAGNTAANNDGIRAFCPVSSGLARWRIPQNANCDISLGTIWTAGDLIQYVGRYDTSGNQDLKIYNYDTGAEVSNSVAAGGTITFNEGTFTVGNQSGGTTASFPGELLLIILYIDRVWSDDEITQNRADPFAIIRPMEEIGWLAGAATGVGGGITGTLAKTLDNTTSSITAILSSIGSLSETLDNTTSSASGTVGSGITGSLAETLAATTSSIAGGIYGTGSLSKTLDSTTSNIAGSLSSIGSISQTLEDATSAAAGGIYGIGSLSRTLDYTTLSASGFNQHIEATLSKTLEDVTLAAYGVIPVTDTKIWFNKMGGRILGVNDITDTPYTVDDD